MTRLTLADLASEKPVRLTVEISARLQRELAAYAIALNSGEAKGAPVPEQLIPPMNPCRRTCLHHLQKSRHTVSLVDNFVKN